MIPDIDLVWFKARWMASQSVQQKVVVYGKQIPEPVEHATSGVELEAQFEQRKGAGLRRFGHREAYATRDVFSRSIKAIRTLLAHPQFSAAERLPTIQTELKFPSRADAFRQVHARNEERRPGRTRSRTPAAQSSNCEASANPGCPRRSFGEVENVNACQPAIANSRERKNA